MVKLYDADDASDGARAFDIGYRPFHYGSLLPSPSEIFPLIILISWTLDMEFLPASQKRAWFPSCSIG
jgi:hypothetical protein